MLTAEVSILRWISQPLGDLFSLLPHFFLHLSAKYALFSRYIELSCVPPPQHLNTIGTTFKSYTFPLVLTFCIPFFIIKVHLKSRIQLLGLLVFPQHVQVNTMLYAKHLAYCLILILIKWCSFVFSYTYLIVHLECETHDDKLLIFFNFVLQGYHIGMNRRMDTWMSKCINEWMH